MLDPELLAFGQKFHGHKCPAMPMGLRTALAAMEALGVEHASDGQLMALRNARLKGGKPVCKPCSGYGK